MKKIFDYKLLKLSVKLPDSFTCAKCVLQWRWFAASTGILKEKTD